jgi:hypothetical protein
MRIADIGCGAGVTTEILHGAVQPGGSIVASMLRRKEFHMRSDATRKTASSSSDGTAPPLDDLGTFDFVMGRFVIEYFSPTVRRVENFSES